MANIVNVGIYGAGLIGASLGLALKKYAPSKYRIFGIGRNNQKLRGAKKMGALDFYSTRPEDFAGRLDVIVLAMRVDLINSFADYMAGIAKRGSVITDVGSVKGMIASHSKGGLMKNGVYFIPAHPIAGLEKTGYRNAKCDLFRGSYTVICPQKAVPGPKHMMLRNMWMDAGSGVIEVDPVLHDRLLGITSHLPHIISMVFLNLLAKSAVKHKEIKCLTAGSFRDLTRISDSDPGSWAEICYANRIELEQIINNFQSLLGTAKKSLRSKKKLEKMFEKAKNTRNLCLHSTEKIKP